jgi:tungstate transport system permease protein
VQIYLDGLREGWGLLASDASGVWQVVVTSIMVSGAATLIALAIGLPAGVIIGAGRFIGRRVALVVFNAGMGLPPVVVGLVVAMALSRRGPLGSLSLLYSKNAMVMAQLIIALPVIIAVSAAAVGAVPSELQLQARSLGASRFRVALLTLRESRLGLFAAVAGGFGAIISEVGAVMMVGGNLAGDTRVMTTAIMMYTRQGQYGQALALSLVLLSIVVFVNVVLTGMQTSLQKWERRE